MIPTEKDRVTDAFETIGNLENYMITWGRDCDLLLKACDEKVKNKALPQPERDHVAKKVIPALKIFQKHVLAAKAAATTAITRTSDAALSQYADAHAVGQAVGATTQVLLAAAGAAVAPLNAAMPLNGKPYLYSEARMKELLTTYKVFQQDFPRFTSGIKKLSAPVAAPPATPGPARPASAAPAKPAPTRPGAAAPARPGAR